MVASVGHLSREPWGAPRTGVHRPRRPSEPGTSQASQRPSHARSQQTPSAQIEDAHSIALAQLVPSSFAQVPFAHELPAAQIAEVQQAPSVQNRPKEQSRASLQGEPAPPAEVHAPPLHLNPFAQSSLVAQVALQVTAPHAYAPHDFGTSAHVPSDLQVDTWVSTPPVQPFAPHATLPAGRR